MTLEILGSKVVKVDVGEDVQVFYKTGGVAIYSPEKIKHLIVNPDEILSITISKKAK